MNEPRENRMPAALLPYQQRWVSDTSPVKVYEKSRRIGISWAAAAEAALVAASQRGARGTNVFYVGYNKDMAEEFIHDAASWARHYSKAAAAIEEELWKDGDEEILTFVIRFASGFRIVALSSRPSNLRGKQGLVILDEAAFHPELGELLKAALALLMWGGRVAVISTHDGAENAFAELVQDVRAQRKPYSLHRTTIDDALSDGLYRRICLVRGKTWTPEGEQAWLDELLQFYGEDGDEELRCVPKNSAGAYLGRALLEARMEEAPVVRLELPETFALSGDESTRHAHIATWCETELAPLLAALPQQQHVFGQDFGRRIDLSVIAPMTITQDLRRRVPFLVELRRVPFESQRQILHFVIDRLPRFLAGALDATGNGAYLAEVTAQRYGAGRIAQVQISEKWYAETLPVFKAGFEDGLLVVPRDADVLQDLRAFRVINGVPKLPKAKTNAAGEQARHGDAGIALALAYSASRSEVEVYDFRPVPRVDDRGPRDRRVQLTAGFRSLKGGI